MRNGATVLYLKPVQNTFEITLYGEWGILSHSLAMVSIIPIGYPARLCDLRPSSHR
jgi:hypothetical protein